MAKNISSKDSYINLMIAEMQAESKAQAIIRSFIPEGAINGFALEPPPAPDMYYDTDIRKWCPESFKKEKEEMFQREKQRILDSIPDEANPGFSVTGKPLVEKSVDKTPEHSQPPANDGSTVQQEHRCTNTPDAPKKVVSTTPKKKAKPKQPADVLEQTQQDTSVESASSSTSELPQENPPIGVTVESQPDTVDQSKKSRRSAKMDESDFAILADRFIHPTDLKEKKPLFFPDDVREALRTIAGLIPGGKVSPSHVAILIVTAWIDEHRELVNRMLSNKKSSV